MHAQIDVDPVGADLVAQQADIWEQPGVDPFAHGTRLPAVARDRIGKYLLLW